MTAIELQRTGNEKVRTEAEPSYGGLPDSKLCFELARGATFAQLAERLGSLGDAHGGLPLSGDVRVPLNRPL